MLNTIYIKLNNIPFFTSDSTRVEEYTGILRTKKAWKKTASDNKHKKILSAFEVVLSLVIKTYEYNDVII